MAHAILVVHTEPSAPERTDEFNTWYDTVHIPQVIERVGGIVSARRYVASRSGPAHPGQPYLAIYEIEAEDPGLVLQEMMRRSTTGEMTPSEAVDAENAKIWMYAAH